MKTKLIPKCLNNSGNGLSLAADAAKYEELLNSLYYIESGESLQKSPELYDYLKELLYSKDQYQSNMAKEDIPKLLEMGYYYNPTGEEFNKNAVSPLRVKTYYIGDPRYPLTGHSKIVRKVGNQVRTIDKSMLDPDYNLVTNNCANNTLDGLNYVFRTKETPWAFTTPGDIRDFALTFPEAHYASDGSGDIIVPIDENLAKRYDEYTKWNNSRRNVQRVLKRKIQNSNIDPVYAQLLANLFDSYVGGNPEKSPIVHIPLLKVKK